MVKYSRQREGILRILQNRRDHPTADMIYESIRKEQPNISLGTVYRNLSFLANNGQILKLSTGMGPEHYDGFTNPHNHFVCKYCGMVMDMDYMPDGNIMEKASESFGGIIEEYELKFFGKCQQCLSNNIKLQEEK